MTLTTLAIIGLAFSLDLLLGEPPTTLHPVAWFGRLVGAVDREWPLLDARKAGIAIATVLPLFPALVAGGAVLLALEVAPMIGAIVAAIVLFLTISLRMLLDITREVVDATAGDLESAREAVRSLVGRDTEALDGAGIRSAAIESVAENLADGFVSTLLPFALLAPISLPTAAAVVAWVKAVNTLDSMLGYPSKPIGTASARLDDAVMYVPARVSACCLALASRRPGALAHARAWARVPASPNSGWPMATLASGLDVRLEKPGAYVLNPDGPQPTVEDGNRAVSIVGGAAVIAVGLAAVAAVYAPALESILAPPLHAGLEMMFGALESVFGVLEWIRDFLGRLWRRLQGVRT
ncbi:adenosylcobinamide-phosphate synthase CbiB [Natronosalvus amylolyticus]|uniref:adenosylcobinamide-phosphate synthase CbiB n=1 Tax=Natronosalvus amylolyticus TaxID=2961994 RepID=UPI0020C94388|nr:adenosylcobinamide-phosphate synthase CbiB [Natronosalvus amylolyticus]